MATSTISYFRRGAQTPGKGKKRPLNSGQSAAQVYQVTPLFFHETMTNASRMATEENNDSLSFDQELSADGDETFRSRQSNISSASGTFRDTFVDSGDASSLMHSQNLTSIVNNPKKDSLVRKMASLVKSKVMGSTEPKFKPLKESQVEDNPSIPKVNPQKDFKDYFRKVSQASVQTYFSNHPRQEIAELEASPSESADRQTKKIEEVDPFAVREASDPF